MCSVKATSPNVLPFALLLFLAQVVAPAQWPGDAEQFVTLAEYGDLIAAAQTAEACEAAGGSCRTPSQPPTWSVTPSEILVLIMACRSLQERVLLIEEAWDGSPLTRLYLVDDWLDVVPRERQWKVAEEDGPGAPRATSPEAEASDSAGYWDAQSRQLHFMRLHPDIVVPQGPYKWVILADDDTWVQADRLLGFTRAYDPAEPVLFSHILSDAHVLGYDYPCGGAGMLLSAAAYAAVAPRLLTPHCPLLGGYNDLTLGYCAHSQGVPAVHHPNMHCSPDVNRAMRSGENMLDLQRAVAVHRLPAYQDFADAVVGTLATLQGQQGALLEHRCRVVAKSNQAALDSRRFFWTAEAFGDTVATCRADPAARGSSVALGATGLPRPPGSGGSGGSLHLLFVFYGRGVPVARYHRDREVSFVATPQQRAARWPDWLDQLKRLDCARRKGGDTWVAHWIDAAPRVSRQQVLASDLQHLAEASDLSAAEVEASFASLEERSGGGAGGIGGGSWLDELRRAMQAEWADGKGGEVPRQSLARRWVFLDFAPTTTFVNTFETLRLLRELSDLYQSSDDGSEEPLNPYLVDREAPIDLAMEAPPPLALAYEYFDRHVEPDAGLWLNGIALERLRRCPPFNYPINLDPQAHANDWETKEERMALLWHNALAVDIFRAVRFCGILLLHAPRMVPHGIAYLPYSTFRRPHEPAVATALTIGNLAFREQIFAMALLVEKRACRHRRRLEALQRQDGQCPAPPDWKPTFRMRVLSSDMPPEELERQWRLPGARLLGTTLVAFRSEHFLPDAQAADRKPA